MVNERYYPTPSDVSYFINGVELDDVYRVDFKRAVNHQPVYGYDSRRYDFVAQGKELVTGNIIINYRYPGYLRAAIARAAQDQSQFQDLVKAAIDGKRPDQVQRDQLKIDVEDVELVPGTEDKMKLVANRLQEHGFLDNLDIAKRLQESFENRFFAVQEEDDKSVFSSVLDDLAIPRFDITVVYGFKDKDSTYKRIFNDCVIVGEAQTVSAAAGTGNDMSSSAQPIYEVYQFFARTITVITPGLLQALVPPIAKAGLVAATF